MEQLAESVIEYFIGDENKLKYGGYIVFPIKKIDNVPCGVILKCRKQQNSNTYYLSFHIESKRIMNENMDFYEMYNNHFNIFDGRQPTKEEIMDLFENIIKDIGVLRFSKYHGKFYNKNPGKPDITEQLSVLLSDIPTIELLHDNCCVCMDKTCVKTKCEHSLCIECWQNIKPQQRGADRCDNEDDDEEDEIMACPICRKQLYCK